MDFKRHIETAWNLTLKHLVALILITLVMVGVSTFSLGLLAPVTLAGYTQSLLLLIRQGREPNVRDLFSHMNLFVPLLGFSIAVFLAVSIGFMLLLVPGMVIALAIAFCCIYMLPLMTDRRLGLVAAIKESYAMARRDDLLDHVVVVVIFLVISMIGGSVFIGTLFTQPLATLFLLSIYEEKSRLGSPDAAVPPTSQR